MTTLLLAIAAAAAVPPVTADGEIVLAGREIRVRDAADLSELPARERARLGARVIATLPAGRTSIALSRETIAVLARRAGVDIAPAAVASAPVLFSTRPLPALAASACRRLRDAVPEGGIVTPANAEETSCETSHAPALLRYDRDAGVVRAGASLAAGAFLGRVALPDAPMVARGDALAIVSRVGPVEVRRSVTALQSLRHGTRLFVRAEDGTIFAVPAPADATRPEER